MKKYINTCALYLFAALLLTCPLSRALAEDDADIVVEDVEAPDANLQFVTLAWNPNPENNILGYNVYYGVASGNYARLVAVTLPTAKIGIKGRRTYYFAVTAFDANGLESDFSDEVHFP